MFYAWFAFSHDIDNVNYLEWIFILYFSTYVREIFVIFFFVCLDMTISITNKFVYVAWINFYLGMSNIGVSVFLFEISGCKIFPNKVLRIEFLMQWLSWKLHPRCPCYHNFMVNLKFNSNSFLFLNSNGEHLGHKIWEDLNRLWWLIFCHSFLQSF